jgi:hypothetical protein
LQYGSGGGGSVREKLRDEVKVANTFYENKVEQILDLSKRFGEALDRAGISYRVIGGLAVFMHVDKIDSLAARLTRDVDVAIARQDLEAIRAAVEPRGFRYRHAAGIDMFLYEDSAKARSAVHAVFIGEKVRPEYLLPIPGSEPTRTAEGILIASVEDLVRMKLTSFRLKDKVHVQDMDSVGLITEEIEAGLPEVLLGRLAEVRATE